MTVGKITYISGQGLFNTDIGIRNIISIRGSLSWVAIFEQILFKCRMLDYRYIAFREVRDHE